MNLNHINKILFIPFAQADKSKGSCTLKNSQPTLTIPLLLVLFFFGVSLILINPGLVPQPEPYFDLTPIRVTHTKILLPKDLNL
jgi:hypothetical protein